MPRPRANDVRVEKDGSVRLTRFGYYSDFVVYPVVVVCLCFAAGIGGPRDALVWLGGLAAGLTIWSLLEYLLHRFAFHHLPVVCDMHAAHHADVAGQIGTPSWLSLVLFATLLLPLILSVPLVAATGLGCGFVLGYFAYISVHHCIHRWHPQHGSYLHWMKRRHAVHHHSCDAANFGVTSPVWDLVFGTEYARNRVPERPEAAETVATPVARPATAAKSQQAR